MHGIFEPPTWSDIDWIRTAWPGNLVVKGVLSGDDARRALDHGADGVIVSNHGGRQLDQSASTLVALRDVVAAVGDRTTVLADGGIRRGSDVAIALCLGARAVLLGRAWALGLSAAGEEGVSKILEIIRTDLSRTMALLGVRTLEELSSDLVRRVDSI
jgi:isopentenyl diphosphate isomerase/L-lactate dehydrogenase-like FMN-dependent dehydrogenase